MNRNNFSIILSVILIDYILKFFAPYKVSNYGAAFDILEEQRATLIFISFLALFLFLFLFDKSDLSKVGLSLLVGGTLSNLFDRLVFGYVVDYIPFFDLFYFNVADFANVLGLIFVLFGFFKESETEEDEEKILKKDVKSRYKLKEK